MLLNRLSQIQRDVDRLRDGSWQRAPDCLAVEEPLEIRLIADADGRRQETPLTITMRTPGHDFELAAGFLFGEGLVSQQADIETLSRSDDDSLSDEERANTVVVTLRAGLEVDLSNQKRNFTTTSSCGICGKASLDALVMSGCRPLHSDSSIRAATVMAMPQTLRAAQRGFDATGGVHAAGLFTPEGELVTLGEDVGRHNAFDKLIGGQFLAGNTAALEDMAVVLSGRASYELLQKALRARIPIVAAVGAPSSLAVDIAETFGITLVGFLKPGSMNVYAGRTRIRD